MQGELRIRSVTDKNANNSYLKCVSHEFSKTNCDEMEWKYKSDFHKLTVEVIHYDINECKKLFTVVAHIAGY